MFRRRRIRSRRIREQRRRRFLASLLLWFAVVLAIGLLLVQVSRLPHLRVERVALIGNEVITDRALYNAATQHFQGFHFFLFPRQNVLLFSRNTIETTLLEQFPRLAQVSVRATSLHDVEISVMERQMVGVVCSRVTLEETINETCHFVDATGFVFAPAPTFSGDSFFKYYDIARKQFVIGTYFLSTEEFAQLLQLQEALTELGVTPRSLTIGSDGEAELTQHFAFKLAEDTELIFSADANELEMQLQNLQAVLESEAFAEESGGDISTIEYIDLRFGNKVFYRIRESG